MKKKEIFAVSVTLLVLCFIIFRWVLSIQNDLYDKTLDYLASQNPIFVRPSQNGNKILFKNKFFNDFEIYVFDYAKNIVTNSIRSENTQLSLTWSPQSDKVLYQACKSGNMEFKLYLWLLSQNKLVELKTPISKTAAPPIKWSPDGSQIAYYIGDGYSGRLNIISILNDQVHTIDNLSTMDPNGDFEWSPDGKYIAVTSDVNGSVQLYSEDKMSLSVEIVNEGDIKDIAWSPDGKSLLITIRPFSEEYYQLWLINLNTKRSQKLLFINNSDIGKPRWLSDSRQFVFEFSNNEKKQIGQSDIDSKKIKQITSDHFSNEIVYLANKMNVLYISRNNFIAPPTIYSINVTDTNYAINNIVVNKIDKQGIVPSTIHINADSSTTITCIFWESNLYKNTDSNRAIIYIHGGPNLRASPLWDPGIQFLVNNGINFISVNYHGSLGYGRKFETKREYHQQIKDIILVRDYLKSRLSLTNEQIILFGSSYGTRLCLETIRSEDDGFGGLILVSNTFLPEMDINDSHLKVKLVFQGKQDHPDVIYSQYNKIFNNNFKWFVFEREGHLFHRLDSWAKIYSEILNQIWT